MILMFYLGRSGDLIVSIVETYVIMVTIKYVYQIARKCLALIGLSGERSQAQLAQKRRKRGLRI